MNNKTKQQTRRTKRQRQAVRQKVKRIMAEQDAEVRSKWKRPPIWLAIADIFRPGSTARWLQRREQEHKQRLEHAYNRTVKAALNE